jgi:hypothetical protein
MESTATTTALTSVETVEVHMPGFAGVFYTMEPRPVCIGLEFNTYTQVISENFKNRERVVWYDNGSVCMTKPDGTTKIWYPRPTLKDVVLMKPNVRSYTQFKTTGEVVQLLNDNIPWYWGAQKVEIDTLKVTDVIYDDLDNVNDCGCRDDYRCCGWYPSYEDRY